MKKIFRQSYRAFEPRLPSSEDFYAANVQKLGRANSTGWAIGLCPFHDDHNPSLSLNLESGAFKCFSCGASGSSIVAFHMRLTGSPYKEAAKELEGDVYVY